MIILPGKCHFFWLLLLVGCCAWCGYSFIVPIESQSIKFQVFCFTMKMCHARCQQNPLMLSTICRMHRLGRRPTRTHTHIHKERRSVNRDDSIKHTRIRFCIHKSYKMHTHTRPQPRTVYRIHMDGTLYIPAGKVK